MPENTRTSTGAIWSLVLGIMSLVLCFVGFLLAIPAVICGHLARAKIRKSAGSLTGGGMALAGVITGYAGLAFSLLLILSSIIPYFLFGSGFESGRSRCQKGQRMVAHAVEEWAVSANVDDGAAVDPAGVIAFLENNELPKCPAHDMPITIPAKVGDPVGCPDPDYAEMHTEEEDDD